MIELLKKVPPAVLVRGLVLIVSGVVFIATGGATELDTTRIMDLTTGILAGWVALDAPKTKPKLPSAPTSMFVLALLLVSCTPQHKVDWPRVLECGSKVSDIVATVTRILLADGPRGLSDMRRKELLELATKHGSEAVACTINQLVHDWTGPGAALAPETLDAAQRGQAFLESVGVEEVTGP